MTSMAGFRNHFTFEMALVGLLILAILDFTVAQTGVCYGRDGNDLPSQSDVVALYNQNNIRRMRIYTPDRGTLDALRGSNIELILGILNPDLERLGNQDNANTWVQDNVRNYPDVRIRYIAVGNEVSPIRDSNFVPFVLPAMRNIQNAISSAGLGDQIRVSTAVEFGTLATSFPPQDGAFRSDVQQYLQGIIDFLVNNRAPFLANIYPYFARVGDPGSIPLDYALFTSSTGVTTPDGTRYQNLFSAQVDAMYAALGRSGGSSLQIVVSESGWPSAGGQDASIDNARMYNTNLLRNVGNGTPRRPGAIETYIFAMFDENQKPGDEIERNFGLFRPNREAKYPISFG